MIRWVLCGLVSAAVMVGCNSAPSSEKTQPEAGAEDNQVTWRSDFKKALNAASEKNRPILVNFSGSDWCGWCIRLDEEVFNKPVFKDFAEDNLVLFVADFPRTKEVPPDTKQQNDELARTYGVRGFPTILLLDKEGGVIGRTGYQRGGPEAYVEHLKEMIRDSGESAG